VSRACGEGVCTKCKLSDTDNGDVLYPKDLSVDIDCQVARDSRNDFRYVNENLDYAFKSLITCLCRTNACEVCEVDHPNGKAVLDGCTNPENFRYYYDDWDGHDAESDDETVDHHDHDHDDYLSGYLHGNRVTMVYGMMFCRAMEELAESINNNKNNSSSNSNKPVCSTCRSTFAEDPETGEIVGYGYDIDCRDGAEVIKASTKSHVLATFVQLAAYACKNGHCGDCEFDNGNAFVSMKGCSYGNFLAKESYRNTNPLRSEWRRFCALQYSQTFYNTSDANLCETCEITDGVDDDGNPVFGFEAVGCMPKRDDEKFDVYGKICNWCESCGIDEDNSTLYMKDCSYNNMFFRDDVPSNEFPGDDDPIDPCPGYSGNCRQCLENSECAWCSNENTCFHSDPEIADLSAATTRSQTTTSSEIEALSSRSMVFPPICSGNATRSELVCAATESVGKKNLVASASWSLYSRPLGAGSVVVSGIGCLVTALLLLPNHIR